MKKFLIFISLFLLPLLGFSQVVKGNQRILTNIHGNSRIYAPRRSSNYHPMMTRRFGKGRMDRINRRREHHPHRGSRPRVGRMI